MKCLLTALSICTLVGCTMVDPNTGETKASNATKGVGIGAVAGALLGAATGGKNRSNAMLKGALAGGAVGGGVGFTMDRQEQKLRDQMQNTGVQLERSGDSLNVVLPGDISFDTGSSIVKGTFRPTLDRLASTLVESPDTSIVIYGHTDSVGSYGSNIALSEARAQAVVNYLQSRGVASHRLRAVAVGPSNPVADNATADGRALNRRVEMKISQIVKAS